MKKLMTMVAAVGMAFGLFADGLKNTTSFENLAVDSKLDVTKDDAGKDAGTETVWSSTDPTEETGTITPYGTDAKYDYTEGEKIAAAYPGDKYLAIDNSATLYRNVNAGGAASSLADNNDIFFDTLVKINATEDLEIPTLDEGAKLAIWAGTAEDSGVTNLYVTAAAGATGTAAPEAANYMLNIGAGFDFNAWHRITVRSLEANTDAAKVAGFVIFVDGVQAECVDNDYATKIGNGLTLTTEANKFKDAKQLFIGLVYGDAAATLAGFGFKGNGAADDVSITDAANAPQFAKGEKVFTLSWDKDAFDSITAGGKSLTVSEGSAEITLDGQTTELTVIGVAKAGYKLIGLESDDVEVDNKNNKFTGIVGAADGSIVAKKVYFTVNGEEFATFADAMAAATIAGKPIVLTDDYVASAAIEGGEDFDGFTVNDDLTIDLAGKSFTTEYAGNYFFTLKNDATLTLTNSVANAATVGAPADNEMFRISGGKLVVAANSDIDFNGGLVSGGADPDVALFAGNYDAVNNNKESLELHIDPENYEVVDTFKDGYLTVQKIDVTVVPVPEKQEFTYNGETQTAYSDTDAYTVGGDVDGKDADSYTATFTLKDETKYKWADEEFDGSITWTITPAAVTVTPKADQTKVYDDADPTFTYDVELLGKDTLDGALAREEGEDVGEYAFTLGTLANDNYELTLADNAPKFTITAKAVAVTVELDKTEANVGDAAPEVTVKFDGVAHTETGDFDIIWTPALDMNTAAEYSCTATAKGNYSGASEGVKFTVKTAGPVYPQELPDIPEVKEKYAAWANGKTIDNPDDPVVMEAFLLNCDLSEVETERAKFKIVSIKFVNDKWEVKVTGEKGQDAEYGNGYVDIVPYEGIDVENGELFQAKLVPAITNKE